MKVEVRGCVKRFEVFEFAFDPSLVSKEGGEGEEAEERRGRGS